MQRNIGTIIVGFLGVLMGFYVIVQVTMGGGNSLATAAKFLAGASLIFGLLKPRAGLIWIIVLCGYSDMLKRMMVFDSHFTYLDISFVLGMAPACLAGVTLGCLGQGSIRAGMTRSDFWTFVFCSAYFCYVVMRSIKGGAGLLGAGKVALLDACFVYAIFVGKVLFRDRDEMFRYLRYAMYLFLPVAFYGIYQGIMGLTNWEIAYLKSGYSVEMRQLFDVRARAFSTLNAASTLTVICALFALFVIAQSYGSTGSFGTMLHPINFLIFCTYIAAMILTYTRAGWLAFIVGIVALFLFNFRFTTVAYYISGVLAFLVVFFGAEYALQHLASWQHAITGGEDIQAFRIVTWSDRLLGLRNLSQDLSLWTPFGHDGDLIARHNEMSDRNSPFFYHDAFTRFVLHRGFIPLILVGIFATVALFKTHKRIFSLDADGKRFAVCLFACIVCVASVGSTHAKILQFPVNFFFWIIVGFLLNVLSKPKTVVVEQEQEEDDSSAAPAVTGGDMEPGTSPAWSYYRSYYS